MKNRIIACIKDTKTDSHGPLTIHDSERDLIMSVQQFAKENPQSLPSQHPNDFVVKVVGEYDQDAGTIHSLNESKILGTMFDIINPTRSTPVVMAPVVAMKNKRKKS